MLSIPADKEIPAALIRKLRHRATLASKNAHCPYSHFPVGAAVLTNDGRVFSGANVENSSYGLTVCAERNAIFRAVSSGSKRIRAVVIVTESGQPTPPCGACRQVMAEFGREVSVVSYSRGGKVLRTNLAQLLPLQFDSGQLKGSRAGER